MAQGVQSALSVLDMMRGGSKFSQELDPEVRAEAVVLGQKYAQAVQGGREKGLPDRRDVGRDVQGEGRGEVHARAHADFADHGNVAAHEPHQTLADGQAQASALVGARISFADLGKGLEQGVELVVGDADAGVGHAEEDAALIVFSHGEKARRHGHAAGMGELEGVADHVRQHLLQSRRVSEHGTGNGRIDFDAQLKSAFLGDGRKEVPGLADDFGHVHGRGVDGQHAGLDPRQVQDVGQQPDQSTARLQGRLGVVFLLGIEARELEQLQHAHDAVERGADFVAHVGQELGLALVARLGLVLGVDEFALDLFALGHVAGNADEPGNAAVGVAHGAALDDVPAPGPVAVPDPVFDVVLDAAVFALRA